MQKKSKKNKTATILYYITILSLYYKLFFLFRKCHLNEIVWTLGHEKWPAAAPRRKSCESATAARHPDAWNAELRSIPGRGAGDFWLVFFLKLVSSMVMLVFNDAWLGVSIVIVRGPRFCFSSWCQVSSWFYIDVLCINLMQGIPMFTSLRDILFDLSRFQ